MAIISDATKVDKAFKFVSGKGYTTTQKGVDNEDVPSGFIVGTSSIFSKDAAIPTTAPGASTTVLSFYGDGTSAPRFAMVYDISSPLNKAWYASTNGSTLTTMRATRVPNWIPTTFGNYTIRIFLTVGSSTTTAYLQEIFFADATAPLFDYKTGILTFESDPIAAYASLPGGPPTGIQISGYVYTGPLLSQIFDGYGNFAGGLTDTLTNPGTALAKFFNSTGLTVTPITTSTNSTGLTVTGNGTGSGVNGTGGGSSGAGVRGTGGNTNGIGIVGIGGSSFGIGVSGQGTGNGFGVVGTGAGTGAGVVAQGGSNSSGLLAVEVNGTFRPVIITEDYAGNVRTTIADHNGFPMFGNTAIFRERWDGYIPSLSSTTLANNWGQRWSFYSVNSSTLSVGASSTNYPHPVASLLAENTVGAYATLFTAQQLVHTGFTGLSFAMEWDAIPVYSFSIAVYMGLDGAAASGDLSGSNQYIRFNLPGNGAHWHAQTNNGGAGTDVDTGVINTGASGVPIRFRIEVYGSASPLGAATARFFINGGSPVATISTTMPSIQMNFGWQIKNPGGSGLPILSLGNINACWNLQLNLTNPL